MKNKIICTVILFLLFEATSLTIAGFKLGMPDLIKHKSGKMDEKVAEKKEQEEIDELPTVSITNPADGSTVAGTVNVTVDASDDKGVDRVQFYIDDVIKSTDTSAPYNYSWDTTLESDGSHTVKVIVYDTTDQIAIDQHTVTVDNTAEPHELPDTGQGLSYTATFGEDNDYEPASSQPSYTDNGDGTITDNRTGLMWAKDGNSAGCNNGNRLTWEGALTFCEGLDYASYDDWRLPNRRELMSIVDYGEQSPEINTTYFPNTKSNGYWTSTTYVPDDSYAWVVYFINGCVSYDVKTNTRYVRLVRGGPIGDSHELPDTGQEQSYTATYGEDHDYQPSASSPSYTIVNSSVVLDNRTGLMWMSDGNSAGCLSGGTTPWEDALTFCEGLDYAGYDDWRLPNVRELESIVDAGESNPAINTTYFPNTKSTFFWTSTTYVPDDSDACIVGFNDGSVHYINKPINGYVRPVRGGP